MASKRAAQHLTELPLKHGAIGYGKRAVEANYPRMKKHQLVVAHKEKRIPKDKWLLKKGDFVEVVDGFIKVGDKP